MTAAAINIDDKIKPFTDNLEMVVGIIKIHGRTLNIIPPLIRVISGSEKIKRTFRSLISQCDGTCEDRHKCVDKLLFASASIRDNFVTLLNFSDMTPVLLPFRFYLKNAATYWDDLVEDFTILADPDIKNLLNKVANAA